MSPWVVRSERTKTQRANARARLRSIRAKRDQTKWQAALKRVEETARGTGNLMPVIVEAVEANATVGEISDAMRHVYGEYHETVVI